MSNEEDRRLNEYYDFFSERNYEKSRRFNEKYVYNPEPLKKLLLGLGNPQENYRSIHIAGTAGKRSTATFLARGLSQNYVTGLYVSPHLETIYERISVQMQQIESKDFFHTWDSLRHSRELSHLLKEISFFDSLTVISMIYFQLKKVQWAVFETGLGGRLDSTNVLNPEFCVLTQIDLDHQNILGKNIEEIATEKAGIIKDGVPVYANVKNITARNVLETIARGKKTQVQFFHSEESENYLENNLAFAKWILRDYFKKPPGDIDPFVRGRLEILGTHPRIIFDSAHNIISFKVLISWLNTQSGKWNIYLNTMKERNLVEVMNVILSAKKADLEIQLYLFPINEPGYHSASELSNDFRIKSINLSELAEKFGDISLNHLITGSMRIYPAVCGVLKEINRLSTQRLKVC